MNFSQSEPIIFGQIRCFTKSRFNDLPIYYDISKPLGTYDCDGNLIDHIPNIGIDSSSGKLACFEELSRSKFCDSSFSVKVRTSLSSKKG